MHDVERIKASVAAEINALAAAPHSLAESWDVIVIGAGPAGCTAATQLARFGATVLILERQCFPRHKLCGCCLSEATVTLLNRYNLAPAINLVQNSISCLTIFMNGSKFAVKLPRGKAVSRGLLDSAMVLSAVQAGSTFCQGISATVLATLDNERLVSVSVSGMSQLILKASIIIVADGLGGSSLQKIPALANVRESGTMIGVGTVMAERERPSGYEPESIYMACTDDGYVGLVNLEDNSLNVAAALNRKFVRSCHSPALAVETVMNTACLPSLDNLEHQTWRGSVQFARRRLALADERVFVIGDAASYVEPFTGEGMLWSITSGLLVAPLVELAIHRWDASHCSQWENIYNKEMARSQAPAKVLSAVLKNSNLRKIFGSVVLRMPNLARTLVHYINSTNSRRLLGCN